MNERRAADLEARLRALELVLQSERAAREEFLATLSHELRNPLNAILGWATILTRRTDLPESVMQGVQAIERNSRLQARMISDLLEYAALGEGKLRLTLETVDPYPVVRAALEGVAAAARAAGIALEASFDQDSMRIEADAARLQQIVGNLLTNAIRFSNRGEAVRLTAGRSGESFRLVVSDRGKGIETEFLPRIFDRLDMAIVKQLTGLHSGSIRAESAGRGLGATFILELPLSRPPTGTRMG
jgi:signal transduction histidine kinase